MKKRWILLVALIVVALVVIGFTLSSNRPYRFLSRYPIESERRVRGFSVLKLKADLLTVAKDASAEFARDGISGRLEVDRSSPGDVVCCSWSGVSNDTVYMTDDEGSFQTEIFPGAGSGVAMKGHCYVAYFPRQSFFDKARDWFEGLFGKVPEKPAFPRSAGRVF